MWDVFAASYKQQKRTIKDLIAETFQVTSCLYNIGLRRVGKSFFIANDCDLCVIWEASVISAAVGHKKFIRKNRFKRRV